MAKTVNVEVRLPQQTADEIRAIAKLAGLSPESVIKLAVALDVRRWQREAEMPPQPPMLKDRSGHE